MHQQQQSPLMRLPAELQLAIFEYAILEEQPLLVNCGCDSNYPGDSEEWQRVRQLWTDGEISPPCQPALTRTCALVREITLPMFYQQNAFRAHYCWRADPEMAVKWLKMIGGHNRRFLQDFCFWDWNQFFDRSNPRWIQRVKRSDVCRELGGKMETLEVKKCCCHRVTFTNEDEDYYEFVAAVFDGENVKAD